MSLKKIEQVRSDKGFKIFDLIVYAVVLVAIAVMFAVFVFASDDSAIRAIRISYIGDGESRTVFTYDFDADRWENFSEVNIEVAEEDDGRILLFFYVDESKSEYNEIIVDKTERSVWVEDANCRNKTCMNFGKLRYNNQAISCSPHGYMVIEPLDYKVSGSVIV